MDNTFPEFSYGFAVTYGLLRSFTTTITAPEFPSLRDEAEKGYDLKLREGFSGIPLFIQYKLSNLLIGPRAAERWFYGGPYFRFDLRSRLASPQHNVLSSLSQTEPDVYYVAPRFVDISEFNNAFENNEVVSKSQWIPVEAIPPFYDDRSHKVTFVDTTAFAWHSMDYEEIVGDFSIEHLVTDIEYRLDIGNVIEINEAYLASLRDKLVGILRENEIDGWRRLPVDIGPDHNTIRDIHILSTSFFNLELRFLRLATADHAT